MKTHILILLLLSNLLCLKAFAQNQVLDSLQRELAKAVDDTTKILIRHQIAARLVFSRPDSARSLAAQLIRSSRSNSFEKGICLGHGIIGLSHAMKNEYDQAISAFRISAETANRLALPRLEAEALNRLGNCYVRLEQADSAIYYLLESLRLFEQLGNDQGIAACANNIGYLYEEEEELDLALQYYQQAFEIRTKAGDRQRLVFSYIRLGNIFFKKQELDKATAYYQQYLEAAQEFDMDKEIANAYSNLGNVALERGRAELALQYYEQSLELFTGLKDRYFTAYLNNNLAKAYLALEQADSGLQHARTAAGIAAEISHLALQQEAYSLMASAQSSLQDYRVAFETQQQLFAIKDSLQKKKNAKEMAELQAKFENEKMARQLARQDLELEKQTSLKNRILTISIIAILLLLAVFQYLNYRLKEKRRRAQMALQMEQAEASRLRELDQMKSNFFANISHEFRTPLTLILTPLQQMIDGTISGNKKNWLRVMDQNGRRLLQLVNQLLDLSRLESGKMGLQLQALNANQLFSTLAYSFESLAESRQINYQIRTPDKVVWVEWDQDKIQKALTNLLTNAFKFTPSGGSITASMSLVEEKVRFEISDTGIGIPEEALELVFERFYQLAGSEDYGMGTGIGLALCKELVELHQGSISLDSEIGKGSTFRIELPPGSPEAAQIAVSSQAEAPPHSTPQTSPQAPLLISEGRAQILLVEDHPDLRRYLKEQLEADYLIQEASDGMEGLKMAIANTPDLIISDVMMPKMDGLELCARIKEHQKTSHIPVILLTAKTEQSHKNEGLATGADAYLIKPFNPEELQIRVQNLIEQRRQLRDDFSFKPAELKATSLDVAFLQQVRDRIEEHLGDEHFGVVELGKALGFSRSQLHRKLKALTDKSPSQLIREMRLHRAKELLEQGAANTSEAAYFCGFGSPAHFSNTFKSYFGVPPSKYRAKKKEEGL